jgi:hypothetical protein
MLFPWDYTSTVAHGVIKWENANVFIVD